MENTAEKKLDTYTADELASIRCKRLHYTVDTLLHPGLAVLAGSPKIGKSWLVMQLCMKIAAGEPFWGLPTQGGSVLYIALEDSLQRLQQRLLRITADPPEKMHFSVNCSYLEGALESELAAFVHDHPDTRLIVIDTFQKIRTPGVQLSYSNDYTEAGAVKRIADALGICILLVHHTRKMGDSDAVNEISGTNGIAGCADTLMVLKKEKRSDRKALLTCTGRDIEDREMEITLDRTTCLWKLQRDSFIKENTREMPALLYQLAEFIRNVEHFDGTNAELQKALSAYCGQELNISAVKQAMNRYRYQLEDCGVSFMEMRTNSERRVIAVYAASHDLRLADESEGCYEA